MLIRSVSTVVFTILRNNATNRLSSTSDASITAAMVVVWQSVEMSYSIAAATIAALKRFTESLNTGFGHGELMRVHGHSQAYKMSDRSTSLKHSGTSKPSVNIGPLSDRPDKQSFQSASLEGSNFQQLKLRPEKLQNETTVSSLPKSSDMGVEATDSAGSAGNIIRHDLRYSVHYDDDPLVPTSHREQQ